MFKSLPAIEKEFDMKEVDKATPYWLKVVLGVFVMLIIMGAIWADWAMSCASDGTGCPEDGTVVEMTVDRAKVLSKMWMMAQKLKVFEEEQLDLIIEVCNEDKNMSTGYRYFCMMGQMYALRNIINLYDGFVEDLMFKRRSDKEIALDFEKLNNLMDANSFDYYDGKKIFDFISVHLDYLKYEEEK